MFDCRAVLAAGIGGGPIEDLAGPVEGRLLAVAEVTRPAFDGVLVRELEALDPAVASCLVGDLVGDCWGAGRLAACF